MNYEGTKPNESAQLANVNTTIGDDSLVENRITGLLDSDNPYMQRASLRGEQQAAQRGLTSSSIAAGAVEGARIDAALPIAQQDAQTFATADLQDSAFRQQGALNSQNYTNETSLADQGFGNQTRLNTQQGDINSRLQSEQGDINSRLQNEQFGYNTQLNTQQGNIQSRQAAQNQGYAVTNQNSAFQQQRTLNNEGYQAQSSQQAQSIIAQNNQQTQVNIANIQSNPNLSEAQRTQQINSQVTFNNANNNTIQRGSGLAETNFTYGSSSGGSNTSSVAWGTNGNPPYAPPAGKGWRKQGGVWGLVNT